MKRLLVTVVMVSVLAATGYTQTKARKAFAEENPREILYSDTIKNVPSGKDATGPGIPVDLTKDDRLKTDELIQVSESRRLKGYVTGNPLPEEVHPDYKFRPVKTDVRNGKGGGFTEALTLKTWVGGSGSLWSTAANWSPAGVPTPWDSVVIDNNATVNITSSTDSCGAVTVAVGNTLNISTGTLTVSQSGGGSGNVRVAGTLNLYGTLNVAGNFLIAADITGLGVINSYSGSTVNFNGSGNQAIGLKGTGTLYNVTMTGGGTTKSLDTAITIEGNLTINTNVTFAANGSNIFFGGGVWDNQGIFSGLNSVFTLNGSGAQTIYDSRGAGVSPSGVFRFGTLVATGNVKYLHDSISVADSMVIQSGNTFYLLDRFAVFNGRGGKIRGDGADNALTCYGGLVIRRVNGNGNATQDMFPDGFERIRFENGYTYYDANSHQIVRSMDADGDPIYYYGLYLGRQTAGQRYHKYVLDGEIINTQFTVTVGPETIFDLEGAACELYIGQNQTTGHTALNVQDNGTVGGAIRFSQFSNPIHFVAPAYQTIYITGLDTINPGSTAQSQFNDVFFDGTQGKDLVNTYGVSMKVLGTFRAFSGVTYVNLRTNQVEAVGSGTRMLEINDGVILYVRGANNFPDFPVANITLGTNSTVQYDGTLDQTIKGSINYGNLITGGNGTFKTIGSSIPGIYGDFQINAGVTLRTQGYNLTIQGYWTNWSTGIFEHGNNTVIFAGDQDQQIRTGGQGAGKQFYNVTVNKTGGVAQLYGAIYIDSNFYHQAGTFSTSNNNYAMRVNGTWRRDAGTTFDFNNSTVTLGENGNQTIIGTGDNDFYNLTLLYTTPRTITVDNTNSDSLHVAGNLVFQDSVTLDISNDYLKVGGNFDNRLGTGRFTAGTGAVVLVGSATQAIYSGYTGQGATQPGLQFNNLIVRKADQKLSTINQYDLYISGNFNIISGIVQANYAVNQYRDVFLVGDWINNATFTPNADTIHFIGAGQTISGAGANDFYVVRFAGSGTKNLTANMDVNYDVLIESGVTLNLPTNTTIYVGGHWLNYGAFQASSGSTVELTGTRWMQYIFNGGISNYFYNLKINKISNPNGWVRVYTPPAISYNPSFGNLRVANNITIEKGYFDVYRDSGTFDINSYDLVVGGSFIVKDDGQFLPRNRTVTINGSGLTDRTIQMTPIDGTYNLFNSLIVNAPGSYYTLKTDLTVANNFRLYDGTVKVYDSAAATGHDLKVGNDGGTGTQDTLLISGGLLDVGDNSSIQLYADANNNSALRLTGGQLKVVGRPGSEAVITRQSTTGTPSYKFNIENGAKIAAKYAQFEYMDTDGVWVQNGAEIDTLNNFSYCTFTNGSATAGSCLLRIDNNQSLTGIYDIKGVNFPKNSGTGTLNIRKSQDQGTIILTDPLGIFADSAYEGDPFNRINWYYTTILTRWLHNTGAGSDQLWTNALNWSNGVPDATRRVVIPGGNRAPIIDVPTAIAYNISLKDSLVLGSGANRGVLRVLTDFNVDSAAGNLVANSTAGNDTLYIQGNYANTIGIVSHNNKLTVNFNGQSSQNINTNTNASRRFYNLVIQKTGTATLGGDIDVRGDVKLINGSFDVSSYDIYSYGNWEKWDEGGDSVATFIPRTRSVYRNGTGKTIRGTGETDFYNLVINGSDTLKSSINVTHTLQLNVGGYLDVGPENLGITLSGYGGTPTTGNSVWFSNGGTFVAREGTVLLNGSNGNQYMYPNGTVFHNLEFAGVSNKFIETHTVVTGNITVALSQAARGLTIDSSLVMRGANNTFTLSGGTDYNYLYLRGTNSFPDSVENANFSSGSIVIYDRPAVGDSIQTVKTYLPNGNQINYSNLYLRYGYKTLDSNLKVTGTLYVYNNTTLRMYNPSNRYFNINVGNNLQFNDGANARIDVGSQPSTITLDRNDGTGTGIYLYAGAPKQTFWNLNFTGSGARTVYYDSFDVRGNITVNAGVAYLNLQNFRINGLGGSNTLDLGANCGLYIRNTTGSDSNSFPAGFETITLAASSTVYFDRGNQVIPAVTASGSKIQYGNIYFYGNGAVVTKTLDGDLNCRGNLTIEANTTLDVSTNNYTINCGGYWYNTTASGVFQPRSGRVIIDGSGIQYLYSGNLSNGKAFNKLYLRGNDVRITQRLDVNDSLAIESGNFSLGGQAVYVGGNWYQAPSTTVTTGTGSVTFNRNGPQYISATGRDDFYDLVLSGSGAKYFMTKIDVNRHLTINAGDSLIVNSGDSLFVGGNWTNNGVFIHNNNTVIADGTVNATFTTNMNSINQALTNGFYNFVLNKPNQNDVLLGQTNSDLYVGGNLIIIAGSLDVNTLGFNTVYCYGDWDNRGGTFIARGDTVYLRGKGSRTLRTGYTGIGGNYIFNHLQIDSAGTYTLTGYQMDVRGVFNINRGTIRSNGYDIYYSTTGTDSVNIAEGGVLAIETGSTFYVYQNSRVNVGLYGTAGTLTVIGDSANPAIITRRTGAGTYALTIGPNGTIGARYYKIERTNANGVWVQAGGTIQTYPYNFSDGNFAYPMGVAGATALRIDSLTTSMTRANNNAIWNANFSVNPGGGANNVTFGDATDTLQFVDATGVFSGDTYDNPTSTGIIEWIFSDSISTWNGTYSTNWFNPYNWTPAGVPDGNRRVVIAASAVNHCYTDTNNTPGVAYCKDLTIEAGTRQLMIMDDTLVVHGDITINGTLTVMSGQSLIQVKGNWSNPGTFNPGGGRVRFDSTGIQTLVSGGTATNKRFSTLEVGRNSILAITTNAVQINDTLFIDSFGTLDNVSNVALYVGKKWDNDNGGYYKHGTSTTYFNGTAAAFIYGRDSSDFYNVVFENSGAKTFMTNVDIRGGITIQLSSGVVDGNGKTIQLSGNWDNYATFTPNLSTVIFNGAGQNIYGGGTGGNNPTTFSGLRFEGTGTKTLFTNINIDSGLFDVKRNFDLNVYTVNSLSEADSFQLDAGMNIYLRGYDNFPKNFEYINMNPTSVTQYIRDSVQLIETKLSDGSHFYYGNLLISKQSSGPVYWKRINGDLQARGYIQISTAAMAGEVILDVSTENHNITCGGNFLNYGLLLSDTNEVNNTLTFNGSANQNFYPEGTGKGKRYFNIIISNTGTAPTNYVYLQGLSDLIIRNNLNINEGNFSANGTRDITVQGNWNATSGTFTPSTSTVILTGATKTIRSNGSSFENIRITGSYSLTDAATFNGNMTVLYGSLDLNGQVLNLGNAATDYFVVDSNATLEVDAGAQLKIFGNSAFTVQNGAVFRAVGVSGNVATVTRNNAANYYGFTMSNGTKIHAKYAKFEYMNTYGIYINSATIDTGNNFSYCTFDNGMAEGKMLYLKNNTDTLVIRDVNFPTVPTGQSYNVAKEGAAGHITMQDATGAFEGADYELDAGDRVDWVYTTNTRQWTGKTNTNWHNPGNWSPKSVPTRDNNVIINSSSSNMPTITADTALAKTLQISQKTLTLNGRNLIVTDYLTIDGTGTITVTNSTDTIFVGGNWTNSSNFNHGNGVVIFNGNSGQTFVTGGTGSGKQFYNIVVNKSGGSLVMGANDLQVNNDLRILQGTFNNNGRTTTINGEFYNAGTFTDAGSGEIRLSSNNNKNLTSNGSSFNNLRIDKTSTGSITLQDNLTVVGNLNIASGTLYSNKKTIEFGDGADNLTVSGTLDLNKGSNLRMYAAAAGNTALTVNSGGRINIIGTPDSNVTVTRRTGGTSYYGFTVSSGGTIAAKHALFEYMNTNGVSITTNGTNSGIDATYDFDSTTFTNGQADGSLLKLDGNFTTGDIWMTGVTFPTNAGGVSKNVTRTNATSGDSLIMYDASGAFEGEAYSSGAYLDWRYSTTTYTFDGGPSGTGRSWKVAENWNPNGLPDDATKNALIPSGFTNVQYDTNLTCNNITIRDGATVNVNATKRMRLVGSLLITGTSSSLTLTTGTDTMFVAKSITIGAGATLTANNNKIVCGENWTTTGTFNYGTGNIIFNGTGLQTINTGGTSKPFYNVRIDKPSGTIRLASSLQLRGLLNIVNGIFDLSSSDIEVYGSWYNNGGTFIPNGRTVSFVGNINSSIETNGTTYYRLVVNKNSGNYLQLNSNNNIVTNEFTVSSGGFRTNNRHLTIGGNVTLTASVTMQAGDSLILNGSTASNYDDGNNSIANLVINKTGATVTSTGDSKVINHFIVRDGTFDLSGRNFDYGDAATDSIRVYSGDLLVSGGGNLKMTNGTKVNIYGGSLSILGTSDAIRARLTRLISGNYSINVYDNGTLVMGYGTIEDCNNFNVSGLLQAQAAKVSRFGDGTVININNNGIFRAIGTDTTYANRANIGSVSGNYRMVVASGGTLDVKNAGFFNLGGSGQYGITLQSGALIESTQKMDNTFFLSGTGNAYISMASDQFVSPSGVRFDSAATNRMLYNVSNTSGNGRISFVNYKGTMSGVRYEQDNGDPSYGRVRWSFNETQNVGTSANVIFGNDFRIKTLGNALGSTTVRLISDTLNVAVAAVMRYYTVQSANTVSNDTIRLYYGRDELNNNNKNQLHIWRRSAGVWAMIDTMPGVTMLRDTTELWVQAANYPFRAGILDTLVICDAVNDASLPVELAYFRARSENGKVTLEWRTESELNNAYWLVFKKEISEEEYDKLNKGLITIEQLYSTFASAGQLKGAGTKPSATDYIFEDTEVKSGARYAYRIADVSYDGKINVHDAEYVLVDLPKSFRLSQNYPNPFNPNTTIEYDLPVAAQVTIKIYNILGQEVQTLVNKKMEPGFHKVRWNGLSNRNTAVASGVYIYRITAKALEGKQRFTKTHKMMVIK